MIHSIFYKRGGEYKPFILQQGSLSLKEKVKKSAAGRLKTTTISFKCKSIPKIDLLLLNHIHPSFFYETDEEKAYINKNLLPTFSGTLIDKNKPGSFCGYSCTIEYQQVL